MKKRKYKYKKDVYRFKNSNEYEYTNLFIHEKGKTREKKAKATPEQVDRQNQRNKETRMRRLLKKNFRRGDWWLTLKYPKGTRKSLKEVQEDLQKFIRNTSAAYKRRGYPFQVGIQN